MDEHADCLDVKADLISCFKIYKAYEEIIDSNIIDFYTNDLWSKLPNTWKSYFEKITLEELGYILDTSAPLTKVKTVSPLSVLALRATLKQLSITRTPNVQHSLHKIPTQHTVIKQNGESVRNAFDDFKNKILRHPKVYNNFWKRVFPREKHEITNMAQMCADVAKYSNCDILINVGSGLGHLSRMLAYGYETKVYCLETRRNLFLQALVLETEFHETVSKYFSEKELKNVYKPVHINMNTKSNITFTDILEEFKKIFALYGDNVKFGVIGLQPCGDLAAMLLKSFNNENRIQFISVTNCCYNNLTTEGSDLLGYPLSTFLRSRDHYLSYASRELSCHAIETCINQLKTGNYVELKTHAFRASLEQIIVKFYPDKKHADLESVNCTKDLTFEQYCNKALNDLYIDIPKEDIMSDDMLVQVKHWKKVVTFYSLRLMFAPMIETIMLLDRFLFLAEADVKCVLLPIFDPKVSPRSHVLIATKTNKHTVDSRPCVVRACSGISPAQASCPPSSVYPTLPIPANPTGATRTETNTAR